jgi:hypothetical protein
MDAICVHNVANIVQAAYMFHVCSQQIKDQRGSAGDSSARGSVDAAPLDPSLRNMYRVSASRAPMRLTSLSDSHSTGKFARRWGGEQCSQQMKDQRGSAGDSSARGSVCLACSRRCFCKQPAWCRRLSRHASGMRLEDLAQKRLPKQVSDAVAQGALLLRVYTSCAYCTDNALACHTLRCARRGLPIIHESNGAH